MGRNVFISINAKALVRHGTPSMPSWHAQGIHYSRCLRSERAHHVREEFTLHQIPFLQFCNLELSRPVSWKKSGVQPVLTSHAVLC